MAGNFSSSGSSFVNRSLNSTQEALKKNFEKLSSGKRINRAADDAAGLAIADALKSDAVVLRQANRNISDAQSALEIADSALTQVSDISVRLQELSVQSANGTLSDEQRTALNTEFQQLTQEIQRIGSTTEFNGRQLLDGSQITVQAGGDSSASSQLSTSGVNVSQLVSGLVGQSIDSAGAAQSALTAVQNFASTLSSARGEIGATSARLTVASSKNESERVNSLQAESRIRDVDIAEGVAENVRLRILQQQGTALAAQGNLSSSRVLDLLK